MIASRTLVASIALFALAACGGGGGGGGVGGGNNGGGGGGNTNRAPAFTSGATASTPENTTGAFYTAAATDPDGQTLTFSISGGDDAARFSINSSSGALSFVAAPDFEAPADANGDNVYAVTLRVSDGALTASLSLSVTVTNVAGAISTRRVATGLSQPLFLTPLDAARLLVVQKGGQVRILTPATGTIAATPFLNVSSQISTDSERGLLGLALAPDFATSRRFYVFLTNPDGDIELRRYQTQAGNPDQADTSTADVILTIEHSAENNHNGGWMDFGPDGLLYIATGDGGGGGDPEGDAQNVNSLLGKILRIDVSSDAFPADANRDYAIPAGNPFASTAGADEIWLTGLRNPWRNAFDLDTGNLWIGDVGQEEREEINLARPNDGGRNYGWNILEGTLPYAGGPTAGLTPPVAQYAHDEGESITGGYVYRGPIASLVGHYFFADFITSRIWSLPVSGVTQGTTLSIAAFTERTTQFAPDAGTISNISSFGEDEAGNLYIVDYGGEIFVVTEEE